MASNARGSHTSPGVYSKEVDLSYSVQSLGITTLGLAGETLKGPAFEPIDISTWSEFNDYFGGTSAEKFKGTDYPKYELPYIAKSYLSESKQLRVCRVLGLSGYNAGPAWLISINRGEGKPQLVAVLRSRGHYEKYAKQTGGTDCEPIYKYDEIVYDAAKVTMSPYVSLNSLTGCVSGSSDYAWIGSAETYAVNANNLGQFTLNAYDSDNKLIGSYGVSLNAGTKNYILNVLGGKQEDGDAPLFVEELYDVALQQYVENSSATTLHLGNEYAGEVSGYTEYEVECVNNEIITACCDAVISEFVIPQDQLTKKQLGQRYVACKADTTASGFTYTSFDESGNVVSTAETVQLGYVYTVKNVTIDGIKKPLYVNVDDEHVSAGTYVYANAYDSYVTVSGDDLTVVRIDMNDYKEQYRCASTPWIVSEIKGDGQNLDVKKLFRFHTISDGNDANMQVKVSIQNILPDEGLFDVLIRDYADSDGNMTILERYSKCSMVEGTNNFIGYKIGTTDGAYALKSKYVTVEVVANDITAECVPAGFLGYPIRVYDNVVAPELKYNVMYDDEIKDKKQYFGMSDLVGVDVDVLTYKGVAAYKGNISGYTNGFHLDSHMDEAISGLKIGVDGAMGYKFSVVSPLNVTDQYSNPSLIGTEEDMADTIYANKNLRKFTVYPYGGFDGWDVYRDQRSNTDDFKANKYKGTIEYGVGRNFSRINNGDNLGLSGNCITSDYYAYLAAYRQFCNKEEIDMNVFATPGIDYVNQKLLSQDALDMIEEERMDSIYVMTTPDKPAGASDAIAEMYTPAEVVENLEDSEIDSSYACTYYPWVKYLDSTNNIYINLPVTKDVVRNMAMTDNNAFPWYAPAGINRGPVDCYRAHYSTKLDDEDTLYSGLVNPVKTFSQDGVKIWGNKTMYTGDTPLNRINTRRLMLRVRKLIETSVRQLIFDPNDATVKSQFLSIVNPILSNVKSNRGISDYKVEVDDSVEARDRHELPAVIRIKPINALEYIDLTFYITPEGASWED